MYILFLLANAKYQREVKERKSCRKRDKINQFKKNVVYGEHQSNKTRWRIKRTKLNLERKTLL